MESRKKLKTHFCSPKLWTNKKQQEWFAQKQQMDRDLYVARQLQQSLLPRSIGDALCESEEPYYFAKPHYKSQAVYVSGFYNPCEALGGDLYDVFTTTDDRHLVLSMVDVSGHGVAASLITAMSKAAIARLCHQTQSPGEILAILNQEIQAIIHTGDYLTAWIGFFDQKTQVLTYARGGHPMPLLYRRESQQLETLAEGGMILGWLADQQYDNTQVQMEPGDALLLYTDGASEMQNKAGEMFGVEQLQKGLRSACENVQTNSPVRLDELVLNLSDFSQGAAIGDDVSLLLLEVAKKCN